jgi:hypothetical protein
MAKGPILDYKVEDKIAQVYCLRPDWGVKEITKEVQRRLKEENTATPDNWPGESAVWERLKKLKAREESIAQQGLDEPWNLMTLRDFDIPAEAIPTVLRARFYIQLYQHNVTPLTIRQAKWIARLYKLIDVDKDIANIFVLVSLARNYAFFDHLSALDGTIRELGDDQLLYNNITFGKKIPGIGDIDSSFSELKARLSLAMNETEQAEARASLAMNETEHEIARLRLSLAMKEAEHERSHSKTVRK